jgi:hypothetical protein
MLKLALFTLFSYVAAVGYMAPKPRVSLAQPLQLTDSTAAFTVTVKLSSGLRAGDSVKVNWWKNGAFLWGKAPYAQTTITDTLPAKCGTVSTFQARVRMVYGATMDSRTASSNTVTYTAPACPEPVPTIDSVVVTPAQVSLTAGQTQQFTAATFSR